MENLAVPPNHKDTLAQKLLLDALHKVLTSYNSAVALTKLDDRQPGRDKKVVVHVDGCGLCLLVGAIVKTSLDRLDILLSPSMMVWTVRPKPALTFLKASIALSRVLPPRRQRSGRCRCANKPQRQCKPRPRLC